MKKGLVITAVILLLAGAALFTVALAKAGFDVSKLSTATYETSTYAAEGDFTNIDIRCDSSADVTLKPSEDGAVRVVCEENAKNKHTVTVEEGTLRITAHDERQWYERISFYTKATKVTVYLPAAAYDRLQIETDTGDVAVPADFSFETAEVKADTGDITFAASVTGQLKIGTHTGDIQIRDLHAGALDLTVTTGRVTVADVACGGDLSLTVDTGKATLTNLTCVNLSSTGNTGDLALTNVVASGNLTVERDTGDVRFENSDAATITVKTSTGDVTGTIRTAKIFIPRSSTGSVHVPGTDTGGRCEITTSTGNIEITLSGN